MCVKYGPGIAVTDRFADLAVSGVRRSSTSAVSCKILQETHCCINRTISPNNVYQRNKALSFVKSHSLLRSRSTLHTKRVVLAGGARFQSRSGHLIYSVPSGRSRCLPDPFQSIRLLYHSTLHNLATDSVIKQHKKCSQTEVQETLANRVTIHPDVG
jgi:hypothetical protein